MNSVFISSVELLKGFKNTLILLFIACLFCLPYFFTNQQYLDEHWGEFAGTLLLISHFGFSIAAMNSLLNNGKIFKKPLPIISKIVALLSLFIITNIALFTLFFYSTSFQFHENVDFSKDNTITQNFTVSKKNEYRLLFVTENTEKFHCCANDRETMVNIPTNGDMSLYEDDKLIWSLILPTTYEKYFGNAIQDPIKLMILKPHKNYRFVTNIRKSEIPSNYSFHVAVRTSKAERRMEAVATAGVRLFSIVHIFFTIFYLFFFFYDFLKSLFKKKKP